MNTKGVVLAFLISFQVFSAQVVLSSEPQINEISALLKEAERFYQSRDVPDQADRAIEIYRMILRMDSQKTEALWKLSRSLQWKGDRASTKEEKRKAYNEAERHAEAAVSFDARSVGAQLMLGISYARLAEIRGPIQSIFLVTRIKKAMDAVLMQDPENDVAHLVWGVLYRELPGLLGGSIKRSIKYLKKAVYENPRRTRHYLELARSLHEEGEGLEAITMLKKLLKIKNTENPPQSFYDRQEAEVFLMKLEPIQAEKERGKATSKNP